MIVQSSKRRDSNVGAPRTFLARRVREKRQSRASMEGLSQNLNEKFKHLQQTNESVEGT